MMKPLFLRSLPALSALLVLAATGCTSGGGDDGDKAPAVCPEGNEIAGVCAGVPASALCGADACTAGVACSSVISASDDASLASAASSATAGACIALAPGAYGDVALPGGVSLLGKGARDVTLSRVTLGAGGTGAVLRGVTVKGGGVEVLGEGAQITSCLIDGSSGAGVTVGPNASLSMASSEVTSSTTYGVSAFDVASLAIDTSIIRGSSGPGLWAQCASGCDCPAAPVASIKHTIIRDNKIVGVSMVGVAGSLEAVDVRDNAEAPNFQGSGGVSIAGCSTVKASGLRVLDNSSFGVLVDGSSATGLTGRRRRDGLP